MNRNISIDVLRILSALAIVFIHVTPQYDGSNTYVLIMQPIIRAGLPIFFIISGFFILNSKIESIQTFYKKKLISIIIPFLLFSFMHYAYFHQWDENAYTKDWVANYFKAVIYGSPVNFGRDYFMTALYWFVYTIIGLYLLSPLIQKCMEFINNDNAARYLYILILTSGSYPVLGELLKQFSFSENILNLPDNFKWLAYFVSGAILGRVNYIKTSFLIPAIIFFYFIVMLTCYGAKYNSWYSYEWIDGNIAMMALSVSMFALFLKIKINSHSKIITYISSLTYGVYLSHIFILSIVDSYTKDLGQSTPSYVFITVSFVFLTSLILSSVVNFLIAKRLVRLLS
ncbi:acyltransferase [Escherichia coli]|uniref:acyltransferase n=1 Tax=Enterobacteriaceae TaxID=543 RepID=UPI000EF8D837|nr:MULTISPECIES: acyltransferase [Enterobacteriaceae]EFA3824844.1 acyltransferase [Escherichia coli]EFN8170093.1 acyltransferase [Escherichia coli]EHK7396850.1 acyltransferase [Escherichia coli]MBA0906001.1 acyltransferase [Escherichia coli]RLW71910.1 acyltransferase [Escherichia coli]